MSLKSKIKKQMINKVTQVAEGIADGAKAKLSREVEFPYIQANSFEGFKRQKLSSYGYKPIEDSIKKLQRENPKFILKKNELIDRKLINQRIYKYKFDFTGLEIVLKQIHKGTDEECIIVLADDNHIGTLFRRYNEELYDRILRGEIQSVYLDIVGGKYKCITGTDAKSYRVENYDDRYEVFLYVK